MPPITVLIGRRVPARNQLRSPSRGLCLGAEGRGQEGWAAAPPLLPTLLPHSCSFTAGPTLQAHKGEAHCKQLIFMWKPLDLHLSFPGRACSRPAALRPESAGSTSRERQGNRKGEGAVHTGNVHILSSHGHQTNSVASTSKSDSGSRCARNRRQLRPCLLQTSQPGEKWKNSLHH